MALNSNKPAFGLDIEERAKRLNNTHTQADTSTPTLTHTHTQKEKQTARLHMTAKPSVKQKLEDYARESGDTLNGLVLKILDDFIEKNGL